MKTGNSQNQSAFIPSLLIKDKPHQSLALLMHLKKFSEMLFAWGQSSKAILISKIISKSYTLFETIQTTGIELYHKQRESTLPEHHPHGHLRATSSPGFSTSRSSKSRYSFGWCSPSGDLKAVR